uniref:Nucleolar protein 4-like b n=1 Tax=Hucho hucho TaxID=62062 RepID=A0A4W5KSX5_9TELE
MHVEMGADPGRAPKHAGQKKTYKAIAETYAFLPREAVTRFLMSCGECQKRMHINPNTAEFKENDRPTSLVPDLIDYNMPLTATYLKQMKLQCMTANERVRHSVCACVCARVCAHVCVNAVLCVCEKERGGEREKEESERVMVVCVGAGGLIERNYQTFSHIHNFLLLCELERH